jgi:Na+/alanine symporter
MLAVYGIFCAVGATVAPSEIWTVADFAIGSMTLINLAVLCRSHREVVEASRALMGHNTKKRPSR